MCRKLSTFRSDLYSGRERGLAGVSGQRDRLSETQRDPLQASFLQVCGRTSALLLSAHHSIVCWCSVCSLGPQEDFKWLVIRCPRSTKNWRGEIWGRRCTCHHYSYRANPYLSDQQWPIQYVSVSLVTVHLLLHTLTMRIWENYSCLLLCMV